MELYCIIHILSLDGIFAFFLDKGTAFSWRNLQKWTITAIFLQYNKRDQITVMHFSNSPLHCKLWPLNSANILNFTYCTLKISHLITYIDYFCTLVFLWYHQSFGDKLWPQRPSCLHPVAGWRLVRRYICNLMSSRSGNRSSSVSGCQFVDVFRCITVLCLSDCTCQTQGITVKERGCNLLKTHQITEECQVSWQVLLILNQLLHIECTMLWMLLCFILSASSFVWYKICICSQVNWRIK